MLNAHAHTQRNHPWLVILLRREGPAADWFLDASADGFSAGEGCSPFLVPAAPTLSPPLVAGLVLGNRLFCTPGMPPFEKVGVLLPPNSLSLLTGR